MNRIKSNLKTKLMAAVLIGILITSHMMQVMAATTEPIATVSTFSQLYQAMIQAKDGDVIGINGFIDQFAIQDIGYADKHITLKRMSSSSIIRIQSESTYQNITFDGGEIDSSAAFVMTGGNVTFQDCTFQKSMTSTANGGAVYVINQSATFNNCTFDNNAAIEGGHIYIGESANVTINNSTFENGHASSDGGAIKNTSKVPALCDINSSLIRNNSADGYGGGISNTGYMDISSTKIYDNTAPAGGADIARFSHYFYMSDALELDGLLELYQDDEMIPTGWVNDYNPESSVEFPAGFDLSSSNVLMKLEYEIPPTEVILESSSLGLPGDGKITDLEPGKLYKVASGDDIGYSKADGSLTPTEAEAEALTGSEIIGLINGETYLVEEYILPVVEEPEEPTDPVEEPTEPEEPIEEPTDPEPTEPDPTEPPTEEPVQEPTTTNNTTTTTTTTDNSSTSTSNSSTVHNSDTRDESSTVNNYSYDYSKTESVYMPSEEAEGDKGTFIPSNQNQTVTIDYGSLVDGLKVQEDDKNITINVNVTLDQKEPEQPQIIEVVAPMVESEPVEEAGSSITWIELIMVSLLFGILVSVIRKPGRI